MSTVEEKRARDHKEKLAQLEKDGKLPPAEQPEIPDQEQVRAARLQDKESKEKETLDPKAIESLEKEVAAASAAASATGFK